MIRPICFVVLATVLVPSFAAARPPRKNSKESQADVAEAKTRFKRALDLYDEGSFDAARAELRRAYDIAPSYKLLYNLGQIEFELHDYPAALADFSQFLSEGGTAIAADRRAEVERDVEKLKSRVAQVEIIVDIPNADISVDDTWIGASPLSKPVLLSAGKRSLAVAKAGFVTSRRLVDLAGGDTARVELHLESEAAPTDATRTPEVSILAPLAPHNLAAPQSSTPVWIAWGTTGVLAVGAAITGGLALDASHTLQRERATFGISRHTLDVQEKRVQTLAMVSDVAAGGALVAGAISLYLSLTRGSRPADERASSLQVVPTLGAVNLVGAF